MSVILMLCAAIVIGAVGVTLYCFLAANDTAAERLADLDDHRAALRAYRARQKGRSS